MCWNKEVSLNTFLFSSFVFLLILYNNKYTFYKIPEFNRFWMCALMGIVILMQLIEYFIWINIDNIFYNKLFTSLAMLIIFFQPITTIMNINDSKIKQMLLIIFLVFIAGILINYFIIKNYKNLNLNILLDKEYSKPQSFHKQPVLCFGGSSIYILFLIIFLFFNLKFFNHFFLLATAAFFIGFVDDLKIKIRPLFRLILIFFLFFTIIKFLNININDFNIDFLNKFFKKYYYLELIFITLCFVFIINGSNFIDGFNGLLTLHALIILFILNFINYYFLNDDLLIF